VTRLIAVLCLVALAGAGAADAGTRQVRVNASTFTPITMDVILDDTVRWTSWDSTDNHDVQGPGWGSGELEYLDWWEWSFDAFGTTTYVCNIHPVMQGTIVVHPAFLRGPASTVLFGNAMSFNGLAPLGETVEIQRDVNGTWTTVDTVVAGTNDAFSKGVKPAVPGRYRAQIPAGTSPEVAVSVKPRVTLAKKRLLQKRTRVTVTASPNRAGAVAVLQRKKPAGWAAIASKRLNTSSKVAFVVRPPKGTWRVRAIVKASGGYAAGQSGVIVVKR
jgi:plastocyanin